MCIRDRVRPALDVRSALGQYFHLAALTDHSGLAAAASAALNSSDNGLWLAVLDTSIELDAPLQASLLASALRHSSATIASETAWRLAIFYDAKPQSRAVELLASL